MTYTGTSTYDMPNLPELPNGWRWMVEGDISDYAFSEVSFSVIGPEGKRIEVSFITREWAAKNDISEEEFKAELQEMAISKIKNYEEYEAARIQRHKDNEARVSKFQAILKNLRGRQDSE